MKTQITIICLLGLLFLISPSAFAQRGSSANFSKLTAGISQKKMSAESTLKKLETNLVPVAQKRFPKMKVTAVSIDRTTGGITVHGSNGESVPGNTSYYTTSDDPWNEDNYGVYDSFWDWYHDVEWTPPPAPPKPTTPPPSGIPAYKDPLFEVLDSLD